MAVWKNPAVIFFVLASAVADWLWFRPKNVLLFVVVEAAAVCAILVLANWATHGNGPNVTGSGKASSRDVGNLVP